MNTVRMNKYERGKELGYEFFSYISSDATVMSDQIGENCFILEVNTIQPFVSIGNNVVMWSGNHIGHHSIIGDHVYFTSHVVLSGHCEVGEYSWFGVNSTIRDFCKIGQSCLIAMGSLVTKDTQDNSLYVGSQLRNRISLQWMCFSELNLGEERQYFRPLRSQVPVVLDENEVSGKYFSDRIGKSIENDSFQSQRFLNPWTY